MALGSLSKGSHCVRRALIGNLKALVERMSNQFIGSGKGSGERADL